MGHVNRTLALLAGGLLICSFAAFAYNNGSIAGPGYQYPSHGRVNEIDQRLANEQNNINQGLSNGRLTPVQADNLNQHLQDIATQEQWYLNHQGGHLTWQEQSYLNERLDNTKMAIVESQEARPTRHWWRW